jgi:hypothetical protein
MKQKSQHRLSIQLSPVLFLDLSEILKDSPKLTKKHLPNIKFITSMAKRQHAWHCRTVIRDSEREMASPFQVN